MMDENEFNAHLCTIIHGGYVSLAVALGQELGLFQIMIEADKPMTPSQLADKADLKERYVKEWLGSMVASKIINTDKEDRLYSIPVSYHTALLSKTAFAEGLFYIAQRHNRIKACMTKDGPNGFEFADEPLIFHWYDKYRQQTLDNFLDLNLIPDLQTKGIINRLELGMKVLDLGCGTGNYTIGLAKRFPKSQFTGLEPSVIARQRATDRASREDVTNVNFQDGNALKLPKEWNKRFDWIITIDVIHDLSNPLKALLEIKRVLKDGGMFSLCEADMVDKHSDNAGDLTAGCLYTMSMFICLPSSLHQPPHTGNGMAWGVENIREALCKTGFKIKGNASLSFYRVHFCCVKDGDTKI